MKKYIRVLYIFIKVTLRLVYAHIINMWCIGGAPAILLITKHPFERSLL